MAPLEKIQNTHDALKFFHMVSCQVLWKKNIPKYSNFIITELESSAFLFLHDFGVLVCWEESQLHDVNCIWRVD